MKFGREIILKESFFFLERKRKIGIIPDRVSFLEGNIPFFRIP